MAFIRDDDLFDKIVDIIGAEKNSENSECSALKRYQHVIHFEKILTWNRIQNGTNSITDLFNRNCGSQNERHTNNSRIENIHTYNS